MTQENKKLLLQDLCTRLPYNVKIAFQVGNNILDIRIFTGKDYDYLKYYHFIDEFTNCTFKPYLRPMEDMTEEEMDEVEKILGNENIFDFMANGDIVLRKGCFNQKQLAELHNFLCSIHVDDCSLIEKGLAICITKENSPYEKFL